MTRMDLPWVRCGLPLGWALALALLAGACATTQRDVLSIDQEHKREVALITGVEPAKPPPDDRFAHLTRLQVEASLQGIVARPAKFISFSLGEPAPLLSAEQVAWAQEPILTLLPKLRPDQHLQLRFHERFNQRDMEAELYAQGPDLVFRFTKLGALPIDPRDAGDSNKPLNYVTLVVQPGQRYDYDRTAYYLYVTLFGDKAVTASMAAKLALLAKAVAEKRLTQPQVEPARKVVQTHPDIPLESVRLYVQRLELVLRSREQGLFTDQEVEARKAKLLEDLAPAAPGSTPAPAAPAAK